MGSAACPDPSSPPCLDTPGWLAEGMPCGDFSPNKGFYSYRCRAGSATCSLSYCLYELEHLNGSTGQGSCATCGSCTTTSPQQTTQQKPALLAGSSSDSSAGSTESSSPCLQSSVLVPSPTVRPPRSRIIVSYNGAGKNVDWLLALQMPFQIIPQNTVDVVQLNGIEYPFKQSHVQADMLPFINWIISHYDQLPDHTVLIHPGPDDWHRMPQPLFTEAVQNSEPVCLQKLGKYVWGAFGAPFGTGDRFINAYGGNPTLCPDCSASVVQKEFLGGEYEALTMLAKLMELKDWNEDDPIGNWNTHFRNRTCCVESIISKHAIHSRPIGFYKTLRQMIVGRSDLFWGYAWERFLDHIFRCD